MYRKILMIVISYALTILLTYVLAINIIHFDNVGQPVLLVLTMGFVLTIVFETMLEHMEACDRVRRKEKEARTL